MRKYCAGAGIRSMCIVALQTASTSVMACENHPSNSVKDLASVVCKCHLLQNPRRKGLVAVIGRQPLVAKKPTGPCVLSIFQAAAHP
jgi:hypothetical protein